MRDEAAKLRRNVERYRFLLRDIVDPRAEAVLRELIAEAEARLGEINAWRSSETDGRPTHGGTRRWSRSGGRAND